jgi:hypothetical protein
MALIYSGTPCFGSFKHSCTFFLQSTSYPELQIECHASLVIDGYDLLRDFSVREFRALQLFSSKVLHTQNSRSGTTRPSKSTARIHFGTSMFGVPDAHTTFSPGVFSSEVKDRVPHINQWLRSTLGLRRSGVPNAHTTFSLGFFSSFF